MTEPRSVATKSELAYRLVRDSILRNEYAPGEALNQATLAVRLGISTTPLREALRRLEAEGLVELRSHSDAHVTHLTAEDARDLLEVRLALDPLAAGLAAQRRTKSDIARIRDAASRVVGLPDKPSIGQLTAHREFHRSIYLASQNELLIATLDSLWDKADRYRLVGLKVERDPSERTERTREHHLLVDLVVAGDVAGATTLMRTHVAHSLGAKAALSLSAQEHLVLPSDQTVA